MAAGITRLKRRISELEIFDPQAVTGRSDPAVTRLIASITSTLGQIFEHGSTDYNLYYGATFLDRAPINMGYETHLSEVQEGFSEGKKEALALLNQAVQYLEEQQEFSVGVEAFPPSARRE